MSTRRKVGAIERFGIGVLFLLGVPALAAAQDAPPPLNQADTA